MVTTVDKGNSLVRAVTMQSASYKLLRTLELAPRPDGEAWKVGDIVTLHNIHGWVPGDKDARVWAEVVELL
jgi:hypothetical protein